METREEETQVPEEVQLTSEIITSVRNLAEESSGVELTSDSETLIRSRTEESIGYITINGGCGTGFRVGETYLMSAFHVFYNKIDEYIDNTIGHLHNCDTSNETLLSEVKNALDVDITVDSDEDFFTAARRIFKSFLDLTAYNTNKLVKRLSDIVDTEPLERRLRYQWTENCHVDFISDGRFNIDWKIIFGNESKDIIIVNLIRTENYQIYPAGMLLDVEYRQHYGKLLIRYVRQTNPEIIISQRCQGFNSDDHLRRAVEEAIEWWERHFPNEDEAFFKNNYADCCKANDKNTGSVVFTTSKSFIQGSSGSPVIYMLNNGGIPAVAMIYQGGYPAFFYESTARRFRNVNIDRKCFFGRATTLEALADILNVFNKTRLRKVLFSPEDIEKVLKREEVMTESVKKWDQTDTCFYETAVSKIILNRINDDEYPSVTVIGVPGSGKTAAIRHAALYLQNKKGFTIYPILEPKSFAEKFYHYFTRGIKQVFVFDDPVGSNSIEQDMVKLWDRHHKQIVTCLSKDTKFLFSLRTEADQHEHLKYDSYIFKIKDRTIDLTSPENSLGTDDKICILKSILRKKQLSFPQDTLLDAVVNCSGAISRSFPKLCIAFCKEKSHKENPVDFFAYPLLGMVKLFQKMKTQNRHQYCGLLMCAIFEKSSIDQIFDHSSLDRDLERSLNSILKDTSLTENDLKTIQRELRSVNNVYVENIEANVTFVHSLYKDVVLYLNNNSDFVIKYGSSQLIKERVRVNRYLPNDDNFVYVYGDDCFKKLADRLIQDFWNDIPTGFSFLANNYLIDDEMFFSYIKKMLLSESFYVKLFSRLPVIKSFHKPSVLQMLKTEKSYLHISVSSGSLRLTQYLLGLLGNISDVKLILHSVCKAPSNNIELVKLLVRHGAVLNALTDDTSESVLHYAIRYTEKRCYELSEYLLKNGFSAKARNQNGESLLHYIAKYGSKSNVVKLAKLSLRHGAPINAVDKDGQSILHYTARYSTEKQVQLAKLFVEQGAPLNAVDKNGQYALDYTTRLATDNRVELTDIFNRGAVMEVIYSQ